MNTHHNGGGISFPLSVLIFDTILSTKKEKIRREKI